MEEYCGNRIYHDGLVLRVWYNIMRRAFGSLVVGSFKLGHDVSNDQNYSLLLMPFCI